MTRYMWMVTGTFSVTPAMTMPADARSEGLTVFPVGRATAVAPSMAFTVSYAGRIFWANASITIRRMAAKKI